jgi:hypothetical protein
MLLAHIPRHCSTLLNSEILNSYIGNSNSETSNIRFAFFIDVASQSGVILAAVASDRLAGGPFYDFLERIHEDTALKRLQFWNEAQRYLVPTENLGPMNKYRMAMIMIGTFLLPDSPREVPINPKARRQLIDLLPIDQGDALLTHMAHNVIQVGTIAK